jgi:hypothetical protein
MNVATGRSWVDDLRTDALAAHSLQYVSYPKHILPPDSINLPKPDIHYPSLTC